MLDEYSKYYNNVAECCIRFMDTMVKIQLNEEKDAAELFLMTTVNLTVHNLKSISLLLKNNHFGSAIMICRNIMESFFNVHWAFEPIEKEAVKQRVFQLEADTYSHLEKEIELMEKNLFKEEFSLSQQKVTEFKTMIENERRNYPQLLIATDKGKTIFKSAPSFAKRMGEQRYRYYQIYIFTSLFTHPTPKLKEFYLRRIANDKTGIEIINEPLKETLSYCLKLIQAILGYAVIVFKEVNPDGDSIRSQCFEEVKVIVNKTIK